MVRTLFISGKYEEALRMESEDPEAAAWLYYRLYREPPANLKSDASKIQLLIFVLLCLFLSWFVTVLLVDDSDQSGSEIAEIFFTFSCMFCLFFGIPLFILSASMNASGQPAKVPSSILYSGLATLGLARCHILMEKEKKAREYANKVASYPVPALQKSGEATLRYLDGELRASLSTLREARRDPPFYGERLSHLLQALDSSSEVFRSMADKFIPEHELARFLNKEKGDKPRMQEVYHIHQRKVVQNIGEFVSGDKVDIRDSVISHSKIGSAAHQDVDPENREEVLEEYRRLLEEVWKDGKLSEEEFEFLQKIRKHENISMSDHMRIEREVRERMKKASYPCPKCKHPLDYSMSRNSWNCEECGNTIMGS